VTEVPLCNPSTRRRAFSGVHATSANCVEIRSTTAGPWVSICCTSVVTWLSDCVAIADCVEPIRALVEERSALVPPEIAVDCVVSVALLLVLGDVDCVPLLVEPLRVPEPLALPEAPKLPEALRELELSVVADCEPVWPLVDEEVDGVEDDEVDGVERLDDDEGVDRLEDDDVDGLDWLDDEVVGLALPVLELEPDWDFEDEDEVWACRQSAAANSADAPHVANFRGRFMT
jgi:hypothetical protein